MERLDFFQQICAAGLCITVCVLITMFIKNFNHIWTVDLNQRAFWKGKQKDA